MPERMSVSDAYRTITDFEWEGETGEDILKKTGPAVYRLLQEVIDIYLDIDPDDRDILAAWILAANFKDAWATFPILNINASKGSGKTRLETLIAAIIPESVMIAQTSEAALFRMAEVKRCLLFDEAEKTQISNNNKINLTEMLNQCYKKGGKVIRTERTKTGTYKLVEFPVYVPVVLANIYGIAPTLEDRSITIIMKKTRKTSIIRAPDPSLSDPIIKAINHWMAEGTESIGAYLSIGWTSCRYASFYNNIYTFILTEPSETPTLSDIKRYLTVSEGFSTDGRTFEIWTPILIITFILGNGICESLIPIAQARFKDRQQDETEFDKETIFAVKLYAYLETLPSYRFYTKDFLGWYFDTEGITEKEKGSHWLKPENIGHLAKRMKIIEKKTHTERGQLYSISKEALMDYLEARNAIDHAEAQLQAPTSSGGGGITVPPKQISFNKTQMHAKDDNMPQDTLKVEEKPIKKLPEVCQQCSNETDKRYQWGSLLVCKECLELIKNPPEREEEE